MPKQPGRESTFRTYEPAELLIGYFLGPLPGKLRCAVCGEPFDGYDPPYGARVVLADDHPERAIGEACGVCVERILTANPEPA